MVVLVELAPAPPNITGPTWQKTTDGQWHLPEKTLGWGVLDWWAKYVRSPAGENPPEVQQMLADSGLSLEAFVPTDEQLRFTLWWYAVNEDGTYKHGDGTLRRLKGWGKDPIAAAMALAELCGPVEFSHFDTNGNPVGKVRHAAWVQVAAVSADQTKNTFRLFPVMISRDLKQDYGLEVNKFIIYSAAGGILEAVTSSSASLEGNRPTFAVLNEALALDTPIPTPSGWTSMGDLEVGDKVFGPDGETVTVVYTTPVQHGRDCFTVVFEDGDSIVASDGHFWKAKVGTRVGEYTTKELLNSGKVCRVPRPAPVDLPDVQLPIDPYTLGVWLGDGNSREGLITCSLSEAAELRASIPYATFERKDRGEGWRRFRVEGLSKALRENNLTNNKHVPTSYLRAGTKQRLRLLQGLMDSDGGIATNGQARFSNTNEGLVVAVCELLRSLGEKPTFKRVFREDYTSGCIFTATFRPRSVNPFHLSSKAGRVMESGERQNWKTITAITPCESVPVKCIAVDSDSHVFLAGKCWTATRNTQWWGAGPSGEVNDGVQVNDVIKGNLNKTEGARRLAICNAHIPGNNTVAEADYDAYQKVLSGDAVDVSTLYDALEAPADTPVSEIPPEREDPEGYAAGVEKLREGVIVARGDSVWLPVDSIVMSILDVRTPVTESRRKFLNQVNAHEDSWIAPVEWDQLALTDPLFHLKKGDRITLGFDGSKSNDWTALVACRVEDGMLFVVKTWNPERAPNGEVPREDVDATVRSAFSSYDVVAFRADVKEFEAYVDQWGRDFRKKIQVNATPGNPVAFDMRGQTKRFAFDCERFVDAVIEREVFHDGNPVLRQHVLNARRYPTTYDAISIRKQSKDSSRKIDAAVCAVLAFGARQDFLMSKKNLSRRAAVIM